jgi:hypothetical protein
MGFEERWLADTELLARAGAKFGGRRTSTTHQSTIDIAEPGREVERAAVIFAHGERDSQQAIASLRMAFSPSQFFVGKMSLRCSPHAADYVVSVIRSAWCRLHCGTTIKVSSIRIPKLERNPNQKFVDHGAPNSRPRSSRFHYCSHLAPRKVLQHIPPES